MIQDGANENPLPFVVDKGDNPILVAANVKDSFTADLVD
jgi:hypothetical protein